MHMISRSHAKHRIIADENNWDKTSGVLAGSFENRGETPEVFSSCFLPASSLSFLKLLVMKISRAFLFLLSFFISGVGIAQQPDSSCPVRISLLTCSPGEELYSSFGHTAIRVTDSARQMDLVFNYGTFDDSDPQFYVKFTKGLMRYALSAYPMSDFVEEYRVQGRGVIEQVLQLDCAAKKQLVDALLVNNQEENRYYNYYFHTDNCTTRARDMIVQHSGVPVTFNNILPAKPPTFRQLIHSYLDTSGQYWSKFGIDILLGSHLDKKVTNDEAMFLPDYLLKGFDNAFAYGKPVAEAKQTILPAPALDASAKTLFTPVAFFIGLFLVVLALSVIRNNRVQTILKVFDTLFFLSLGLLGVFLAVLWAIRIDTVCRNNFNLLWALPTHLVIAVMLWSKKAWVKKYFRIVSILTLLLAVCWFFLPQQLNSAIAPILGVILVRAFYRSK